MTIKMKGTASALVLAAMAGAGASSVAAETVEIVYSDTVQESDRRSGLLKDHFGDCLGEGFQFTPYFGATLFKQGTERRAQIRLEVSPPASPRCPTGWRARISATSWLQVSASASGLSP